MKDSIDQAGTSLPKVSVLYPNIYMDILLVCFLYKTTCMHMYHVCMYVHELNVMCKL